MSEKPAKAPTVEELLARLAALEAENATLAEAAAAKTRPAKTFGEKFACALARPSDKLAEGYRYVFGEIGEDVSTALLASGALARPLTDAEYSAIVWSYYAVEKPAKKPTATVEAPDADAASVEVAAA